MPRKVLQVMEALTQPQIYVEIGALWIMTSLNRGMITIIRGIFAGWNLLRSQHHLSGLFDQPERDTGVLNHSTRESRFHCLSTKSSARMPEHRDPGHEVVDKFASVHRYCLRRTYAQL